MHISHKYIHIYIYIKKGTLQLTDTRGHPGYRYHRVHSVARWPGRYFLIRRPTARGPLFQWSRHSPIGYWIKCCEFHAVKLIYRIIVTQSFPFTFSLSFVFSLVHTIRNIANSNEPKVIFFPKACTDAVSSMRIIMYTVYIGVMYLGNNYTFG